LRVVSHPSSIVSRIPCSISLVLSLTANSAHQTQLQDMLRLFQSRQLTDWTMGFSLSWTKVTKVMTIIGCGIG